VPTFQNVNRNVNLYAGYTNPTSGTRTVGFNFLTSSGGATANVASLSTSAASPSILTNLYFDNTCTARFTNFVYPDAGQVTLFPGYSGSSATNDANLSISAVSGNTFITAPNSFLFSAIPTAPLTAGSPFNVTLTAQNACATPATTPNFGKETTPATVTLTSNNPVPAQGNAVAISQIVSGFGSGPGGVASANVTWSEVGTVDLVATVSGYLGSALSPSSTQSAVGRFKPAYFDTTVPNPGCTTFSYSGQPMGISVTAKAAGGTVTANYAGSTWARLVTLSDTNGGSGSWTGNTVAPAGFAAGIGNANTAAYTFPSKATVPTIVKIRASEPSGADGVNSSTGAEATTNIVSGRLNILNAYGSEQLALPLLPKVEYYDTVGWRQSGGSYADSCTNLSASNFAFTTSGSLCTTPVTSCLTAIALTATGTGPYRSPWTASLSKPTASGSGCVTVNLDGTAAGARCLATGNAGASAASAGAPWLQYPWSGGTATNPTARFDFGIYKSKLLYRRENY
jgi:MSHA biogenesis protein MshQ